MMTGETVEDVIEARLKDLFDNARREFPEYQISLETPHYNFELDDLYVKAIKKEDNDE